MFLKNRSSNSNTHAEAAAAIAAKMAANSSNNINFETTNNLTNNFSTLAISIANNPISTLYEIGKQIGSAGPELAWKLLEGYRKTDNKNVCIWFFDRKWVEKFGKSAKRVDHIMECLKRGVNQLDRHRHAKILTIYNNLIETNETLAFATEPVLGSLANITGYLEDRLRQGVPSSLREHTFNDFEIKYGIAQIAEALYFLHNTCQVIHGNICPQSVIVNKLGIWKLAGLEFTVKCQDLDPTSPVNAIAFTSKYPKMSQIDLDFSAPEIQSSAACSQQSDMFSLGLLICSIFNNGRSPIQANLNTAIYFKQLECLNSNVMEIVDRMPHSLGQHIASLTESAPRKRKSSQIFFSVDYFNDPGVKALQCLNMIEMKDNKFKAVFFTTLRQLINNIPKKLWFQNILPQLENILMDAEISSFALQPILQMVQDCTLDEYQNYLLPLIQKTFKNVQSIESTITLFENINILMKKTGERHVKNEILPMIILGLNSQVNEVQFAAFNAVNEVIDYLEESTIREIMLPKAELLLTTNNSIQTQYTTLNLINRIIGNLDKEENLMQILPFLLKFKLTESIILRPILNIYQNLINNKTCGLDINTLATKIMPSLTPALVSVNITMDDFNRLAEILQIMLNIISRNQKNKLKLEKVGTYSIENYSPITYDSNIYPLSTPCLKLQGRRQSISVDNVRRQSLNSNCSSPEINHLKVNCSLPFRRHSDNAIEPPRILINQPNNSSCTSINLNNSNTTNTNNTEQFLNFNTMLTAGSNFLTKRRHSSVNPQEVKGVSSNSFFTTAKNFAKNSCTGSGSALNSLNFNLNTNTSTRVNPKLINPRRYSTAYIFNQSQSTSSNIFNQIGTNVQNLLNKR